MTEGILRSQKRVITHERWYQSLEVVSELSLLRDLPHRIISKRTHPFCPVRNGIEGLDVLACLRLANGTPCLLVRYADVKGQAFGQCDLREKQSDRLARGKTNFLEYGLGLTFQLRLDSCADSLVLPIAISPCKRA